MNPARTTPHGRARHSRSRSAAVVPALAALILVVLVATPEAQQAPGFTASGSGASEINTALATDIDLLVGRSTILNVGSPITRVSLTVPDVADAMVTAPGQLLIHGKTPGIISLFVWDKAGAIKTYEINVRRDLSQLGEQIRQLFPGEPIVATGSGKDVVLSGTVSSKYVVEKAADVAGGYVEKKENVVNLLKQQEGVASNQVMLRVRFAEVSRSALQELGASFVANGFKTDWFGRVSTQQYSAPDFDSDRAGGLVFSDFLNIFVFNAKEGLGGVVRALQTKGLFQSLAEPNLIATNGKEASFLAGGEYPYPVVQPSSGGNSVTIMFKEYGIRLNFTPTVLGGDLINLKVRPEVSSLDFSNAVTMSGFRIPALSTRRTETEVELRDGQTFAIAGLMNNTLNSSMAKIPGIGDIPILGLLFRSRAHQKNQTELVVMITPTIVRRGDTGVSQGLPSLDAPFMGAPDKTYAVPDPWVGSPRYPVTRPGGGTEEQQAEAQPAVSQPVAAQPIAGNVPVMARAESAPVVAPAPIVVPAIPVASMKPIPAGSVPASELALPADVRAEAVARNRQIERAREQERRTEEMEARERAAAERRQAEEEAAARKKVDAEQAAADKKTAEADAQARKKAEADQRQAQKLAQERAERAAEVARRNEAAARKQAEQESSRDKSLSDAAARLKQAQTEYEQELQKSRGAADDVSRQSSKGGEAPAAR